MSIKNFIIIISALMMLGIAVSLSCSNAVDYVPAMQLTAADVPGDDGIMQEDPSDGEDGDEEEAGDDESGDSETPGEEPGEEEPGEEDTAPGVTDTFGTAVQPTDDSNLQDALAGIRDYEVTYNTSISHRDNTPDVLRNLNVFYAGEESPVATRTQLISELDLLNTLEGRYSSVEDAYAADPEEDFDPEDSEKTRNYFQPREDPFVITNEIPEQLRPELSGTGLDGSVDPEVLRELYQAQFAANLRYIPIIVVGTLQSGTNKVVMLTFPGYGSSFNLAEGDSTCMWYGAIFTITATQISEDFVVLTLVGGCGQALTGPVVRTFHIPR